MLVHERYIGTTSIDTDGFYCRRRVSDHLRTAEERPRVRRAPVLVVRVASRPPARPSEWTVGQSNACVLRSQRLPQRYGAFAQEPRVIDHVRISDQLTVAAQVVEAWEGTVGGTKLSDHSGAAVEVGQCAQMPLPTRRPGPASRPTRVCQWWACGTRVRLIPCLMISTGGTAS